MKIYSMTATFGKLEHETITLKPGLNVVNAPNEWGKSTWCAFLVNMLYGLDTRAKSTKTVLADKDRYTPWSGAPMAGRIELNWNGRDITIERSTRGRLILGEFKAYETATGIDIPELNATNCGQQLLGVERSVFTRAGFLRLTELPVSQDEALRRRLNNLVTTGDESGAGDKLEKTLKDLKNKCRYNRSGLIPQAEAQRDQLHSQLDELRELTEQSDGITLRIRQLEQRIAQLENHKENLRYEAAKADAEKVLAAEAAQAEAQSICDELLRSCDGLPEETEAQKALQIGNELRQQQLSLQMEESLLPALPQEPAAPAYLPGVTPETAEAAARADLDTLASLEAKMRRKNSISILVSVLCVLTLAAVAVARLAFHVDDSILFLAVGAALFIALAGGCIWSIVFTNGWRKQVQALYDKHPGRSADLWLSDALQYAAAQSAYETTFAEATALRGNLESRLAAHGQSMATYTHGDDLDTCLERWQQIIASRQALAEAVRQLRQAQKHADTLRSMAKTVQKPEKASDLTLTDAETDSLLASARFELKQSQLQLGQFQGRCEALGRESDLKEQLRAITHRIRKLEDTYEALELAQKALSHATTELQRRFAPRISKRAQELFGKLTGSRYDRLTLSEDLSLNVGAGGEDTLRPALWRSEGTVDQLYLALRLAVAEELTPNAPLILDDALVRFDDVRHAAAMDILQETAQNKQVILFTCQGRESAYMGGNE